MIEPLIESWSWIQHNQMDAATLFIAALALIGTWLQARAAYIQNRQSVRPYLHTYTETGVVNGKPVVLARMANTGLGPALIEDYCIRHDGKEYRDENIFTLFNQHFSDWDGVSIRPKTSIPINHSQIIISLPLTEGNAKHGELQEYLRRNFDLRIKYKSFVNQRFRYSSQSHTWPFWIRAGVDSPTAKIETNRTKLG